MKEQSLERYAKTKIEAKGHLCVKLYILHLSGFPDRLVLKQGGEVFFMELKAPKGRLSKLQKYWLAKLEGMGFRAYVVASKEDFRGVIAREFPTT